MSAGYVEHSREPLREVVATPEALAECMASLASGEGPVAFDAERAHGHRYWPKAYLFQIRRRGAGTWLVDPLPFEVDGVARLEGLGDCCGDALWLVHAASQDLPCMRDAGIRPGHLFDTELAARLLGEPSAGLAPLLERKLGISLEKAHSADNWATRPLPESWLDYAALDVDYLLELHEILRDELQAMGRLSWAEEEFAATLVQFSKEPAPRIDPWRRLTGVTSLKSPRQLAVARALWEERDTIGRTRDRPPGRILPDPAIVELAQRVSPSGPLPGPSDFATIRGFQNRSGQRYRSNWLRAIATVEGMDTTSYPSRRPPSNGLPHPRNWDRHHPGAAELWWKVKPAVDELGCDLAMQPSLVAPPAIIQQVVFDHAKEPDFTVALQRLGARSWQVEFLAPLLNEVSGRV
ncbi:HRDC domain-containing protein [Tessaracoccus antarcticus]|uniref:Ribonuclease D n=1 Tax=Tessaracoccus antarcticus TaxID=2479848 RepID=A0A3M0G5H4_9ACTN|nr:HRDC domain-containing protein [Tessaracoccus antarcticus]RMB60094.1 ribonuclease D [Tessaracoccus antarcticus]